MAKSSSSKSRALGKPTMMSKTSKSIGGSSNVPKAHGVPKGGVDSGKPGVLHARGRGSGGGMHN